MSALPPPSAASPPGATLIVIDVTRLPSALWPPQRQADDAAAGEHDDSDFNDLDAMAINLDEFTEQMVEDQTKQSVRRKWEEAAETAYNSLIQESFEYLMYVLAELQQPTWSTPTVRDQRPLMYVLAVHSDGLQWVIRPPYDKEQLKQINAHACPPLADINKDVSLYSQLLAAALQEALTLDMPNAFFGKDHISAGSKHPLQVNLLYVGSLFGDTQAMINADQRTSVNALINSISTLVSTHRASLLSAQWCYVWLGGRIQEMSLADVLPLWLQVQRGLIQLGSDHGITTSAHMITTDDAQLHSLIAQRRLLLSSSQQHVAVEQATIYFPSTASTPARAMELQLQSTVLQPSIAAHNVVVCGCHRQPVRLESDDKQLLRCHDSSAIAADRTDHKLSASEHGIVDSDDTTSCMSAAGYTRIKPVWSPERESGYDFDECYVCGGYGTLVMCDTALCQRLFHVTCANLARVPTEDEKFYCDYCRDTDDQPSNGHRSALATAGLTAFVEQQRRASGANATSAGQLHLVTVGQAQLMLEQLMLLRTGPVSRIAPGQPQTASDTQPVDCITFWSGIAAALHSQKKQLIVMSAEPGAVLLTHHAILSTDGKTALLMPIASAEQQSAVLQTGQLPAPCHVHEAAGGNVASDVHQAMLEMPSVAKYDALMHRQGVAANFVELLIRGADVMRPPSLRQPPVASQETVLQQWLSADVAEQQLQVDATDMEAHIEGQLRRDARKRAQSASQRKPAPPTNAKARPSSKSKASQSVIHPTQSTYPSTATVDVDDEEATMPINNVAQPKKAVLKSNRLAPHSQAAPGDKRRHLVKATASAAMSRHASTAVNGAGVALHVSETFGEQNHLSRTIDRVTDNVAAHQPSLNGSHQLSEHAPSDDDALYDDNDWTDTELGGALTAPRPQPRPQTHKVRSAKRKSSSFNDSDDEGPPAQAVLDDADPFAYDA